MNRSNQLVNICWITAILALVLALVTQSVAMLAAGTMAGILGSLADMVS